MKSRSATITLLLALILMGLWVSGRLQTILNSVFGAGR